MPMDYNIESDISYCGSIQPLGATMIFKNLLLYYVRKLLCKFELFCLSSPWEKDFENIFAIQMHVKTVHRL
jgi:hypothetical protein